MQGKEGSSHLPVHLRFCLCARWARLRVAIQVDYGLVAVKGGWGSGCSPAQLWHTHYMGRPGLGALIPPGLGSAAAQVGSGSGCETSPAEALVLCGVGRARGSHASLVMLQRGYGTPSSSGRPNKGCQKWCLLALSPAR